MTEPQMNREDLSREVDRLRSEVVRHEEMALVYRQAMRELEIKEKAIESFIDAIAFTNLNNEIIYVNLAFAKLWGYDSPTELLGRSCLDFVKTGEDGLRVIKELNERGSWVGDLKGKRKDGSIFDMHLSANMVKDSSGRDVCMMASFVDITWQRKAEETIRESENKFKSIFENVMDGILMADVASKELCSANSTVCRMLGYTREELVGMKVRDIHPPEQGDYVLHEFERQFRGQITLAREIPFMRKDGSVFFADVNSSPLMLDGRNYVLGVVRDVTERKEGEEAVRENEKRYRTLVDNIPGAVYRCLCDEHWTMFFISDAVEEMSGYPASDFLGNQVRSYASVIHPEDKDRVREVIFSAVDEERSYKLEYRIMNNTGEVKWVYEEGQGVYENGDLMWLDGVIFDITERKTTEEQLRRVNEKFRVITENTSDFINTMTFDGKFTYVSPSHSHLGYDPEDLLGKSGMDMIHPDDKKTLLPVFRKYMNMDIEKLLRGQEEGVFGHIEYRFPDKDGQWRHLESTVNLVKSFSDGADNKYEILMVSRDVTGRKKGEAILKEQKELLNKTNKELKKKVAEIEQAMGHIKKLEGLVPICAKCKKILIDEDKSRDQGSWVPLEKYITEKTDANLTHGFCPDCAREMYGKIKGGGGEKNGK